MGKLTVNSNIRKPKTAAEAKVIKEQAINLTAETLKEEFEGIFADELEPAYTKLQEVTEALGDLMDTALLQDNRLYLYEILMDNTTEEIVADIQELVEKAKSL